MDYEDLKKYQQELLDQVYLQQIHQNEQRTQTWMQYKDRHKKNIDALKTLSAEFSIGCVVPLGKRAFMKGKLTHTSEILACIGDGYFGNYSTQQAIALCNRRIKRSEEMLKELEQERNLLEMRYILPANCGAFETGEDCKDLCEYWDDKKLTDWRAEHRKREREYRQKQLKEEQQSDRKNQSDSDLFDRLDQLEIEEELSQEFYRMSERENEEEEDNSDESEDEDETDDEDEDDDENEDEAQNKVSDENKHEAQASDMDETKKKDVPSQDIGQNFNRDNKFEISSKVNNGQGVSKSDVVIDEKLGEPYNEIEITSVSNIDRKSSGETDLPEKSDKTVHWDIVDDTEDQDMISIDFLHSEIEAEVPEGVNNEVNSPRDIYRIFCKPKSILKRSANDLPVVSNVSLIDSIQEEEDDAESEIGGSTYSVVVHDVQERKLDDQGPSTSDTSKRKRPMSRFKLERANLNK